MDLRRDCPGICQRPGLKATGQLGPEKNLLEIPFTKISRDREKICGTVPLLKSRRTVPPRPLPISESGNFKIWWPVFTYSWISICEICDFWHRSIHFAA